MNTVSLLTDVALAAIPAVGFGMLFNVPKNILPYCALGGGLAHGIRYALVQGVHLSVEMGTFIAAALLSFIGVMMAKRLRAHPKACTVAAMIPMVPGIAAYTAIITIVQMAQQGVSDTLLHTAVQSTLRVVFIVTALAVGLALPGLTVYKARPIV